MIHPKKLRGSRLTQTQRLSLEVKQYTDGQKHKRCRILLSDAASLRVMLWILFVLAIRSNQFISLTVDIDNLN